MTNHQEKWAIFWCDLLSPLIHGDIDPEAAYSFLKELSEQETRFPDGQIRKPPLSTLRRKWKRYRKGGFDNLARKRRTDLGKARKCSEEIIEQAVTLKKDQPRRSPAAINLFLEEQYGKTIPTSTLYRHLKRHDATRLKLGVVGEKVRKRWTRDHSNDLWVGDFEHGPYVRMKNDVVPTYLSAFIDCHSRYAVEARYYPRENLDILIDSMIRGLATHGAPAGIYVDNGKVYHATALKTACYRCGIRLLHRPPKDPAPGGLIERFFQTAQGQMEAEVRAGDILTLEELNQVLSAWLAVSYHRTIHSETGQSPEERYRNGLQAIRQVDMERLIESFLQSAHRTVDKTFSDIRIHNRFYRVDPRLRGDRVEVRYDPFGNGDTVRICSLAGEDRGTGVLHHRDTDIPVPKASPKKAALSYTDLLLRKHRELLETESGGIDYRKVTERQSFPFHEFAKTLSDLMGRKSGLAGLTTEELESLKKVFGQSTAIDRKLTGKAFENAPEPSVPYIVRELKILLEKEDSHVS